MIKTLGLIAATAQNAHPSEVRGRIGRSSSTEAVSGHALSLLRLGVDEDQSLRIIAKALITRYSQALSGHRQTVPLSARLLVVRNRLQFLHCMRPSIATDSKQQLRIACDMLRGYGVTRSQRARAVYHEPFIPAAPQAQAPRQHVSISAELERAIWRIRIHALLRRILIGIGLVILLWCAAWLVQIAPHGWYDPHQHELELQAQRQWKIDHPISDSDSPPAVQAPSPRPQIALRAVLVRDARVSQPRVSPTALATTRYTWHNVAPYGDLELNIIGRLPSTRDLPASGSIGDAYLIDEHYWVWAQPVWAAIPTWCDP